MAVQTQQPPRFIADPGDILLYTMSAIGMLAIATLMWIAGSYFTMVALHELLNPWGIAVSTTGLARWIIPGIVSAIEIAVLRFGKRLPLWVIAGGYLITALDFLSTAFGVTIFLGGLDATTLVGLGKLVYTLAQHYALLSSTIAGVILTFVPERILIGAAEMLLNVAIGLWNVWRNR
jgi:hypothetical protein